MKTTIKAIKTKDKCQENTTSGKRCTQSACIVVTHREISSETRKKLCRLHAHDVMLRQCIELQGEIKSFENHNEAHALSEAEIEVFDELFSHVSDSVQSLGVMQKLSDKYGFNS